MGAELGLSYATPEKRPLVTTSAQALLLTTPNSSPATTPPPSACPPPRCPAGRAGQGLWPPPLPRPGDRLHSSPGQLPRPIHLLTQARPAAATTDSPLSAADLYKKYVQQIYMENMCSRFIWKICAADLYGKYVQQIYIENMRSRFIWKTCAADLYGNMCCRFI